MLKLVTTLCPALLLVLAFGGEAQTPRRLTLTASAIAGGHHPSYPPLTAPMLWGVSIGAEASIATSLLARVAATNLRSASTRDDLSICIAPEPQWSVGTNCYEPNYAAWYWLFSTDLLARPTWSGPLYALGGAGWSMIASKAYRWGSSPTAAFPTGRGVWRFGGGLVLGRSVRAPRFEVANSRFAGRVGDAKNVTTLHVWIR
jgi:hypothetical protein